MQVCTLATSHSQPEHSTYTFHQVHDHNRRCSCLEFQCLADLPCDSYLSATNCYMVVSTTHEGVACLASMKGSSRKTELHMNLN